MVKIQVCKSNIIGESPLQNSFLSYTDADVMSKDKLQKTSLKLKNKTDQAIFSSMVENAMENIWENVTGMDALSTQNQDFWYVGCGENKKCIGYPFNCDSLKYCKSMVTRRQESEGYEWEMFANAGLAESQDKEIITL